MVQPLMLDAVCRLDRRPASHAVWATQRAQHSIAHTYTMCRSCLVCRGQAAASELWASVVCGLAQLERSRAAQPRCWWDSGGQRAGGGGGGGGVALLLHPPAVPHIAPLEQDMLLPRMLAVLRALAPRTHVHLVPAPQVRQGSRMRHAAPHAALRSKAMIRCTACRACCCPLALLQQPSRYFEVVVLTFGAGSEQRKCMSSCVLRS